MKARDRTVLMVVGAFVLVAAAWLLVISPKRKDAVALDAQVAAAQQRLATAQSSVTAGQAAKAKYDDDYATVARLGKAVPADDDVPSLVVQLQGASRRAHVDFRSIDLAASGGDVAAAPAVTQSAAVASAAGTGATGPAGATGATGPAPADAGATSLPGAPATQAVAATLPPGAAVGAAGFPTMPFDFDFSGSFFRLQDLLDRLDAFTRVAGDKVTVSGRLLSVDGFSLQASPKGFPDMEASVHATSYLLPPDGGAASAGGAADAGTLTGATGPSGSLSPTSATAEVSR